MKIVVSAVVLLACVSPLESQILASLNLSSSGVPEVRIRNGSAVGLAALAVAINPSRDAEDRTQFVVFLDALFDKTTALEPDNERTVPVL